MAETLPNYEDDVPMFDEERELDPIAEPFSDEPMVAGSPKAASPSGETIPPTAVPGVHSGDPVVSPPLSTSCRNKPGFEQVKTVINDLEDIPNINELGANSLNPISIDECSTYDSTLPTIQNNTLNYEVHMYTAPVKCHNNATITSNRRIRREAARSRFRKPKPIGESRYESNDNEEGNNLSTIQTQNTGLIRSRSDVRNKNLVASAHNIISSNKRLIRPSRVSSVASDRSKFTLRDKGLKTSTEKPVQRGNFRKPQAIINNKGRRPTSSFSTLLPGKRRPSSPPRDNESPTSTARNVVNQRRRNSNGGRPRMGSYRDTDNKSRNRISHEISSEVVGADSNGIITATYEMPEETILSTVNGKSTELKTIVTARKSLLVLNPQQYTKILGSNGQLSLALVSQSSSINSKGATEYTQFRLHEIQTTFVTFTPTTIRGRKTSFSLILPSTAYSVEHVVSTMQPNIQADTPLANILLSQLLLGNIGFPSNLLQGFHSDGVTQSTEYLTRTSTYLTTLYEGKSTVLPITFQGKKIYTTIYDTTAETITATEYITDTIVISPTHSQVPMVNSLLLQQLLLPQLNPQHQYNSNFNQVSATPQSLGSSMSLQEENVKYAYNMEVELEENIAELQTIPDMLRKSGKKHKRRRKDEAKLEDSSIITLYVSGKRPGEFSTILSTLKPDHSLPKRSIQSTIDINKIKNNIKTKVEPHTYGTTQSLNSVVGDVNKWFVGQGHCSSC
uniref:Uncharacterized protein n=1 Tax=Musca domestica TaxID=7370 RepID=A0A1I8MP14_MUSDO